MFATPSRGGTPEYISFRERPDAGDEIPVYFEEKTLLFTKASMPSLRNDNQFSVKMMMGVIDPKYQKRDYFNWPNQGVLGLAPTALPDTDERLNRQFLWQVRQQYPSYLESYALIGGSSYLFVVGASEALYQRFVPKFD